jgi:putative hydrolase of the HAD superfamily
MGELNSMKTYRHIFFDLDSTLWDFERNFLETLTELFHETLEPRPGFPEFQIFLKQYHTINDGLWAAYRRGEISREVLSPKRFQLTFESYGIDDPGFAHWFGEEYLRRSALKDHTFPDAREVLDYLRQKYPLHIITNGFTEVQTNKLHNSGLREYFDVVLSSEEIGINKPDPRIFLEAMRLCGARPEESLMIGDDEKVDIQGAALAGMDQVWYNPAGTPGTLVPTFEIQSLLELKKML